MLAVQNPDAFASIILFGCIVCSFACYIYLGWVLPIKKIRDPNSTKMQKNVYGFVLFAVGICPILYLRSEEHTSELQSPCNLRMPSSA